MKKYKLISLLLVYIVLTSVSNAQINPAASIGSGYCLDFTPNLSNHNYVDLGNLSAIDTSNFTIEMWLNVNNCQNDPAFFSNKDWSSGNNIGVNMDVHNNGSSLRVNLKAVNGSFKNLIVPVNAIGRGWFHVAATFNRKKYLKIYINGVVEDSLNISSASGSLATTYTYKLGQDGTGDYTDDTGTHIRYDGKMDEIRVWKSERTQQEIRDNMCKKLIGNETGLYAYYNCDSTSGNKLTDITGTNNGTWYNAVASSWKLSGAPIGNISTYLYPDLGDWTNKKITLTDPNNGSLIVNNVSGTAGVQIYKVGSQPNSLLGVKTYPSNLIYYGVFLTDADNKSIYDVGYSYLGYPDALADAGNLRLFTRNKNSDPIWSDYNAALDPDNDLLMKPSVPNSREYILGTKQGLSCASPFGIKINGQTDTSFTIGWTSGGSANWNTQWGPHGFPLGKGVITTNTTTNPQVITGVTPTYFYDFYVQDTCNGSSSYWIGPFVFSNQTCVPSTIGSITNITKNSAVLHWNGVGVHFNLEWGLQGFTLGTGIPYTTDSSLYTLTGLQSNTTYSYYVQTNCDSINTSYSGPYTFTTLGSAGIDENYFTNSITIFPNPSTGEFVINASTEVSKTDISILNSLGEKVLQTIVSSNNGKINQSVNLKTFPAGVYTVHITDGKEVAVKRIILQ